LVNYFRFGRLEPGNQQKTVILVGVKNMPSDESSLASQVALKINGSPVQEPVVGMLASVTVDQSAQLPQMFTIRFYDPELELMDNGPFNLTKEVEISAQTADERSITLLKGEITAIEPEFKEGMIAELVVRGYDKSHRLYREKKSKAFLNIRDSQIAENIASSVGLQPQVDSTSQVYEHVFQNNQTDMAFLVQRAWRIGYQCFVEEGTLHFRKPPSSPEKVTLTWGGDLLSFMPRVSLAEQVDEVVVKGWDISKKTAIVGSSNDGQLYPKITESKNGAAWAKSFGKGKYMVVDQPVETQAEANTLAKARLDEISGSFIDAEGVAFRRPDITAGKAVEIGNLGNRFSGTYIVTNATHIFNPEGLKTIFHVRGIRTGLLSEQMLHVDPLDRWPGVVTAIVTNAEDPKKMGRVKVKFPWLDESQESDWARVVSAGAGPEAGFFNIPDVDDEVLVIFEHGDFNQPFVLGGLWNGKDKLPPEGESAPAKQKPLVRTWHSRKGHRITMDDTTNTKIEILTKDGRTVLLDDKNKKLVIKTSGVTLTLDDNGNKLKVESNGEVEIKASTNLKIEASANLDIKAGGQLNLKGTMVNIN
jgi:phage protein D/phage baseplate assembly protein gpV